MCRELARESEGAVSGVAALQQEPLGLRLAQPAEPVVLPSHSSEYLPAVMLHLLSWHTPKPECNLRQHQQVVMVRCTSYPTAGSQGGNFSPVQRQASVMSVAYSETFEEGFGSPRGLSRHDSQLESVHEEEPDAQLQGLSRPDDGLAYVPSFIHIRCLNICQLRHQPCCQRHCH